MSGSDRSVETLQRALAGRYTIERELGRGGMAVVYLARDLRHDRLVALKLVRPELAAEMSAERFVREIEIAARLAHPHIVPLHDSGVAGGFLYYVMPHVDGETLKERIAREGALPVRDALRIGREVADALDYAHRHGVIHRDVKPANILLADGHAVLADFGIARAIREAAKSDRTATGIVPGTPEFMSPEQAAGDRELDGRSDVYSLGCVLFLMLTGEAPFGGGNAQAVMARRITGTAPSVRALEPGVSERVDQLVTRALARAPGDRFQEAGECAKALEIAEMDSSRPHSTLSAGGRWRGRRLVGAIGMLALLALVAMTAASGVDVVPLLHGMFSGDDSMLSGIDSTTRLTHEPGLELEPSLSPNGEFIAYVARSRLGPLTLRVRTVRGGRATVLTDTTLHRPGGPSWSPDGSRIAFHAEGGIYIVPASGGLTRRVVGNVETNLRLHSPTIAMYPAWSPSGTRLAYSTASGIMTVSLDGGAPRKIVDAPESYVPRWSPDGEWLVYTSFVRPGTPGTTTAGSAIVVVRVRDGLTHTLTDRTSPNGPAAWMPDGRSLLFVSNRGGGSDIYRLSLRRDGGVAAEPVRITTGARANFISLSADGTRLAYDDLRWIRNVVSIDIDTQRVQSAQDARPVTRGEQVIMGMSVSPDGQWIAFDSDLGGSFSRDIYRMRLADGEIEQLTDDPGDDLIPSWSPDGLQIAFYSLRNGSRDVFTMNADGSEQRRVTDGPDTEEWADWSPDGRRMVYRTPEAVYVISRDSAGAFGTPRRITTHTGATPVWSPDGAWIAYASAGGVYLVSPEGAERRTLWVGPAMPKGSHPQSGRVEWSSGGRSVYYRVRSGSGWSLWSIPLKHGQPRLVLRNDDPTLLTSDVFAVHDRRLYFGSGRDESDIWLLTLRQK